jgi:NAD(P)-dependent dehydrogenase (short-subunit alcohol dehydrogenase family)
MGMREAWNTCYDINVTGTQITTHTFAPLLIRSLDPRLIFVTSGLSNLTAMSTSYTPTGLPVQAGWPKPEMHPYHAYRPSKTALNMVMLEWHWQLQEDNVKTWCVSPGFLATNIGNSFAGQRGAPPVQHPSVGGKLITSVIEGQRDQDVGKVVMQDDIQPF